MYLNNYYKYTVLFPNNPYMKKPLHMNTMMKKLPRQNMKYYRHTLYKYNIDPKSQDILNIS